MPPVLSRIVLLRGINVSGRNKIPMAELRVMCGELGCHDVQTYIQSGNVLCRAEASPVELESVLERAVAERWGLTIPVIVRPASAWAAYVAANPFPEASVSEPNRVMLGLSKLPLKADAVERLRERAALDERIERVGDALWIHFGAGAGSSKLSPALLDRLAGSPVTLRNWRTVCKIQEMLGA